MGKVCDNKSVGMVVRRDDGGLIRFLMIDRGNYPRCRAMPAGHLDKGSYAEMAVVETLQETGIQVVQRDIFLIYGDETKGEGPIANPCKREGGSWHDWRAYFTHGHALPHFNIKAGDDAKSAFWASENELHFYAHRTEVFFEKLGLEWRDVGTLTYKVFGPPELMKTGVILNLDLPETREQQALYKEWQILPGLEPVWYFMLRKAGFFPWTFQNAPTQARKGLALMLGAKIPEDPFHPNHLPGSD